MRPVAVFAPDYLDGLQVSWADDESGQGPTGTAIRGVVRSAAATSRLIRPARRGGTPPPAGAMPRPVRCRWWTAPGTCFGALNVYSVEPDAFDDEEMRLLEELAATCPSGCAPCVTVASATRPAPSAGRGGAAGLVEASPTILYSLRQVGGQLVPTTVSENVQRILGYSPHRNAGGQLVVGPRAPDDVSRTPCPGRDPRQQPGFPEYRFAHRDGHYVWLRDEVRIGGPWATGARSRCLA